MERSFARPGAPYTKQWYTPPLDLSHPGVPIYPNSPGIIRLPYAPSVLRGPRDANHDRIMGRNPNDPRAPPLIDAGTSYSDYGYWSLYGWRTQPPPNYPQKVVNTPFDETMRDCAPTCYGRETRGEIWRCLTDCAMKGHRAQGTLMDVKKLLHEANDLYF